MNRRKVIISIGGALIGFAGVWLAIENSNFSNDPIAFYCQISTNGISGPPMISCVISNQSQGTVMVWDGISIVQNGQPGAPDASVSYVNFPMTARMHRLMSSGSTKEFKFQLPTTAGRMLPKNLNTNQFRLCARWSANIEARFEILLGKFMKPKGNSFFRTKLSKSEMITVKQSDTKLRYSGEN